MQDANPEMHKRQHIQNERKRAQKKTNRDITRKALTKKEVLFFRCVLVDMGAVLSCPTARALFSVARSFAFVYIDLFALFFSSS